jgi:hypothetical protein
MSLAFIIPHFALDEQHTLALSHCLTSLRRHYADAKIVVLDDSSPRPPAEQALIKVLLEEAPSGTILVHQNPWKGSGEVGALRWYHEHPSVADVACIVHDSMLAARRVDLVDLVMHQAPCKGVSMLWHFDRYYTMHAEACVDLLYRIFSSIDAHAIYRSWEKSWWVDGGKMWYGCFGMGCVVSHAFLSKIHQQYPQLMDVIGSCVRTREYRQAFERVWGMVLSKEMYEATNGGNCRLPAPFHAVVASAPWLQTVCGCIFDHPYAWRDNWKPLRLDEKLALASSQGYDRPFVKTWFSR